MNEDNKPLTDISDEIDLQELDSQPDQKPKINFHLIIILAIVLIAGFSAYRLHKWNQGITLDDTPIDSSEFDIEVLDMIMPIDSSRLEGHEDDGITTVLCFGNNPFSDDRSESGLAAKIADKTGGVVYDCSFPDSSAACKYPVYNPEYTRDHFNLFYVVESFRSNDFTAINSIAGDEPDSRYQESVDVMKTVDMDKVDVIVIMYDSTDYNMGTPSHDPNDNLNNVVAFTGGLYVSIQTIQNTWPHIRVLLMSPTYAQAIDEDGNLSNGTITDLGNGPLVHYATKEADVAMACGVSYLDNYFGTINEDNYKDYMSDYMHYNDAGREKLAERVADVIVNQFHMSGSASDQ